MCVGMSVHQFELAVPQCVADEFDGEVVILHMATGVYYCLQGLGAAFWRDVIAGHPLADLIKHVAAIDTALEEAAITLGQGLIGAGLLRPTTANLPETPPTVLSAYAAGERHLGLDSYDDMRDLVLSDPIHDVDEEMGWPVLKA